MRLIDFSDCKIDRHTDYAGSDRKNAIIYDGDRYMIKFSERQEPKNNYTTSCVNVALDRIGTVSFKEEADAWNEYLRAKEEVDITH